MTCYSCKYAEIGVQLLWDKTNSYFQSDASRCREVAGHLSPCSGVSRREIISGSYPRPPEI
jgi:hypothetical protein